MPVLINSAGQAEELDPSQAEFAIAAGTHSVPLVSPSGDPAAVPGHERELKLSQGYTLPTTDQLQSLLDQTKHGTTAQTLASAAEGAAETASLGTSGALESAFGVPKEEQLKRAKTNPIAHGIGEVAGVVAPALLGEVAPAVDVLGSVGKLAESWAKAAVGGTEGSLAAKLAGWAGKGAAEGATLSGEHVLNEAMLGDPNATAEHAMAEVGLSSLIGGAGGAIVGKLADTGSNLANRLLDRDGGVFSNLTKLKENAGEVTAAAARLGVEPVPGQLSASKIVQDLQSQIAKEPTIIGRQAQASVDKQFEAIRQATADALGESTPMTKAEVGESLRKGITEKLQETYRPISDAYDYLKTELKEVQLDESSLIKATRDIRNIEGVRVSPSSPEYKLAESVGEEVRNLSNVTELRQYASSIARQTTGNPSLKYVGNAIRGILSDLEEGAVTASTKEMVKAGRMSQGELELINNARAASKQQYKTLMEKMGELGDVLGKRKIYGPQDFLSHLSDVPAENVANKLFQKNNSKFLTFLETEFPKQASTLSRYQKSSIAEKAFKDGMVSPSLALREIDKLEPEVQKFLFSPENLAKLHDARTLIEAMPKDINPSGTAKSVAWNSVLNPARTFMHTLEGGYFGGPVGAAAALAGQLAGPEISTWAKRSALRRLVSASPTEAAQHQVLGTLSELAQKTAKTVTSAARAVFSKEGFERLALSKDERSRLSDKLTQLNDNPQKLVDRVAKMTEGIAEHAPDTSSAISSTVGRAVGFLSSKLPKPTQLSPFSKPTEPSDFEKAAFKRSAEAVLDPVGVLQRVADGTVSTPDVQALQSVYPTLYSSMRQAVASQMADAVTSGTKVPYSTRLGVSLFLGEPVDNTLSPQSINTVQMSFITNAARPQPGQPALAGGRKKGSSLALSKVGQEYSTPEQAAAYRRTKQ